jgi:hypothetical protein
MSIMRDVAADKFHVVQDEEMWVNRCDVTVDTADVVHGTRKHK